VTITEQVDLGWRFNPEEPRDRHGQWTRSGAPYTLPDPARLYSERSPYHNPGDHPFFQAHPVSSANIVTTYDRSTPGEKAQGMRWYTDARDVASDIAGGNSEKGGAMLATYSPQTSWPVNMYNASRALKENRALGPGDGMITGAMQRTAQKVLDGAGPDEALKAPKTNAFAHLITNGGDGPAEQHGHVVIDRHALSVAVGQRLTRKDLNNAPIGDERYYQHVADAYRKAAAEITARGTPVTPHQMQAVTWLHQQAANAAEDEAGAVGHGGKGAGKGRQAMVRNAWDKWGQYASAHGIETETGTTALVNMITDQLVEMSITEQVEPSTITSQVELAMGAAAAWKHELRGPDGRWIGDNAAARAGLAGIHQAAAHEGDIRSIAEQAAIRAAATNDVKTRKVLREENETRESRQDKQIKELMQAVRRANHKIAELQEKQEKTKARTKTLAVITSLIGGVILALVEGAIGVPGIAEVISAIGPGVIESLFEWKKRL